MADEAKAEAELIGLSTSETATETGSLNRKFGGFVPAKENFLAGLMSIMPLSA